jgi:hypothetical protein
MFREKAQITIFVQVMIILYSEISSRLQMINQRLILSHETLLSKMGKK